MNKFNILKFMGYSILLFPTLLLLMGISVGVSTFFATKSDSIEVVEVKPEKKTDTVIVVTPPIQITNPVVEKTTNNTTTIINQTPPVMEQPKNEKPVVVTPPIIDSTKTNDTL